MKCPECEAELIINGMHCCGCLRKIKDTVILPRQKFQDWIDWIDYLKDYIIETKLAGLTVRMLEEMREAGAE